MIGFRVDANEMIATGHLMRCIAIAEMCRKKGEKCIFVLAEDKETERLRQRGFQYHILGTRWDRMEQELLPMKKFIDEQGLDWLVVDSYQVTGTYLRELNCVVPVMYIDDLAKEFYPVSAVLHYGANAEDERYRAQYKKKGTIVLMGMEVIPLRDEFLPIQNPPKREKSILVTTGGTDPYNIAGRFVEGCLQDNNKGFEQSNFEILAGDIFKDYDFHIIIGALNLHIEKLQKMARRHHQVYLHQNVTKMSEYMRTCQLAVSAGGTTLYELCACGIPTVCFTFADNQKPGAIAMSEKNMIKYAGDAREKDVIVEIRKKILEYIVSNDQIEKDSLKMCSKIDGKGALRIAEFLVQSK